MTVEVDFIEVWKVVYKPDNVPLWQGIDAALPKIYYFVQQESFDEFLEKNKEFLYLMKTSRTLALKHKNKCYPLGEAFVLSSSC